MHAIDGTQRTVLANQIPLVASVATAIVPLPLSHYVTRVGLDYQRASVTWTANPVAQAYWGLPSASNVTRATHGRP